MRTRKEGGSCALVLPRPLCCTLSPSHDSGVSSGARLSMESGILDPCCPSGDQEQGGEGGWGG